MNVEQIAIDEELLKLNGDTIAQLAAFLGLLVAECKVKSAILFEDFDDKLLDQDEFGTELALLQHREKLLNKVKDRLVEYVDTTHMLQGVIAEVDEALNDNNKHRQAMKESGL